MTAVRLPRSPLGQRLAALAIGVGMAAGALLALELALRVTRADRALAAAVSKRTFDADARTRMWDPALQWRLVPGEALPLSIGRINWLGFVGRETTWRKPPGRVRILTMGDSVTYGMWGCGPGFCRSRPWATALELRLWTASQGDRYEVVNAGVYGYSSQQGLRWFRLALHEVGADVVTVMYGWNDHSSRVGRETHEPANPVLRRVVYAAFRSALWRTAMGLLAWTAARPERDAWLIPETYQPRVPVEEYASNLAALAAEIRAAGARPLFVTEPHGPYSEPYRTEAVPVPWKLFKLGSYEAMMALHGRYMQAMRDVAARESVPLVDVAAEFARRDVAPLFDPVDLIHPNERGSALVAELVHARLAADGIAPP